MELLIKAVLVLFFLTSIAFGNCEKEKRYIYLDKTKDKKIIKEVKTKIIRAFLVKCPEQTKKEIILSDTIRSHIQTLSLVFINNKIESINVINFEEPKKYLPPQKWLEKFKGEKANAVQKIDALTGATLTRQSIIRIVENGLLLLSEDKI